MQIPKKLHFSYNLNMTNKKIVTNKNYIKLAGYKSNVTNYECEKH
jgi:hypothetical protein